MTTPSDNPYAAPESPLMPEPARSRPYWAYLLQWSVLSALNAIVPLSLAPGTPVGLSWPQALAAIGLFAVGLAEAHRMFDRSGRAFLARALTLGAIAKAVLQCVFVPDIILGILALAIVTALPGQQAIPRVFLTSVAFGFGAVGVSLVVGSVLALLFPARYTPPADGPHVPAWESAARDGE